MNHLSEVAVTTEQRLSANQKLKSQLKAPGKTSKCTLS